jgi:hypothetical protein
MNPTTVKLSRPVVHPEAIWFAAYEFGWGFRAFEIPSEIAQSELGATDASPRQLARAFELGRQRIAKAVEPMTFEYQGQRIPLRATDLSS